jgi:hypothetical protein
VVWLLIRIVVNLDLARLDEDSSIQMNPKLLLIITILVFSSQACGIRIPQNAKELAISALCDFPAFSGENLCQRVEITNVIVEDTSISASQSEEKSKKWCIELKYIDFTGERGFACVWLVGPSEEGEYKISRGPLFDMNCVGSR